VVEPTLTIGDFSRATHLSVKMLRHYHDIGLTSQAPSKPPTRPPGGPKSDGPSSRPRIYRKRRPLINSRLGDAIAEKLAALR
jgi:hypothetical protein